MTSLNAMNEPMNNSNNIAVGADNDDSVAAAASAAATNPDYCFEVEFDLALDHAEQAFLASRKKSAKIRNALFAEVQSLRATSSERLAARRAAAK